MANNLVKSLGEACQKSLEDPENEQLKQDIRDLSMRLLASPYVSLDESPPSASNTTDTNTTRVIDRNDDQQTTAVPQPANIVRYSWLISKHWYRTIDAVLASIIGGIVLGYLMDTVSGSNTLWISTVCAFFIIVCVVFEKLLNKQCQQIHHQNVDPHSE